MVVTLLCEMGQQSAFGILMCEEILYTEEFEGSLVIAK